MNYRLITKPSIEPYGGTLIDNVLSDAYKEIFYAGWDQDTMGAAQDFGGGVMGITCEQLYAVCQGSHYRMASLFDGITRSDAKEIMTVLEKHKGD